VPSLLDYFIGRERGAFEIDEATARSLAEAEGARLEDGL
jgi:hypothetical protein